MFSVAIVGSRGFTDEALVTRCVARLREAHPDLRIVSGGAKGADTLGADAAAAAGVPTLIFLPDWAKFGKSAGFMRNTQIVASADLVIAFFANGPRSRGTMHSVNIALADAKPVHVYHEGRWTTK